MPVPRDTRTCSRLAGAEVWIVLRVAALAHDDQQARVPRPVTMKRAATRWETDYTEGARSSSNSSNGA